MGGGEEGKSERKELRVILGLTRMRLSRFGASLIDDGAIDGNGEE